MENQPAGLVFPFPAARALLPFGLPQSGRRSWNPFPSERIPLPCRSCAPSVWAAAVRATLMESVPVGTDSPFPAARALLPFGLPQFGRRSWKTNLPDWFSPSLPLVRSFRLGCRSQGDAHGIRSRRNGFPFPCRFCISSVSAAAVRTTDNGKDRPEGRSFP